MEINYWVVELCKSKREVKFYRMQDYEQFIRIMHQCGLVSGDMEPIGVYDNPDTAMRVLLMTKISIRDHSFAKTQDGRVITLKKI
jgi:hypothetical protein